MSDPTPDGGDIIIKGGSVEINFDDAVYPHGNHGSHFGQGRKMQRILVTDEQGQVQYDSQSADVKKWIVSILTNQAV